MTAPARLLALRLHGFKSFAERTAVEFAPGISAVVGPNGSGKSNLADALRWVLGEQGRALRTRRAEDVIWAGSERRAALGMADVTLVLDNTDGLLPVEFTSLELGRRLYRSGENEYLLNRQRVRLRDLVDLLDAANLADNAFLFIGQGMVDQALALRPEDRRPLFEEAAGVRRHERRRRRAEEQLSEALANLARVEDVLAEIRPQARRLAAQAEQQSSRQAAGDELADGLLASAQARWHEAAARSRAAAARLAGARLQADRALADLGSAEQRVAGITIALAERAAVERRHRAAHEAALAAVTAANLRSARLSAEGDGLGRDRARLADERAALTGDVEEQRRTVALPVPARDLELEAALGEAERAVAEAAGEIVALRAADRARGEELAAIRRAEAARAAELDTARRRLAEADRRTASEVALEVAAAGRLPALKATLTAAQAATAAAAEAEVGSGAQRESARAAAELAEAERSAAGQRLESRAAALAAGEGRLESLRSRLADEERRGIARAARRRGGRRLDEGLVVDPALRSAVDAALAESARAYLVEREAVGELSAERGMLVIADTAAADRGPEALAASRSAAREAEGSARRVAELVGALGGGLLVDAIRQDPVGGAGRLLARAAWLPTLGDCLAVQASLPPGWLVVPRDGRSVVSDLIVSLGASDGTIERRAEIERLAGELVSLGATVEELRASAARAARVAAEARMMLDRARAAETGAAAGRRRAEEAERAAARGWEASNRERDWHAAQVARLVGEGDRLRAALAALEDRERPTPPAEVPPGGGVPSPEGGAAGALAEALATWEQRLVELRARRDRIAAQAAAAELARRDGETRHARAEAAVTLHLARLVRLEEEVARLADREQSLNIERDLVGRDAADAAATEAEARALVDALLAADGADRDRLAEAEGAALVARERLRLAEDQARAAEREGLEADLGLDALRDQLLVELTGLGTFALARLPAPDAEADHWVPGRGSAGIAPITAGGAGVDAEVARMEGGLATAARRWAVDPPPGEVPSIGRLATLRRRFHDIGAANPFAVEEHRALRARLDDLETQRADLGHAIERTRQLIAELEAMIAAQFRTTFEAMAQAFDRRFQQLFGGGFARLSLTDPGDVAATGVEIVARPPGKRAQPLAMLSGGERSLTAVALLLAMLEIRPVPFCVLDEVDAALDEANVGRFTAALRELAQATQFIVITHNRGTIRAADALYGVTVGDDSVSRVISLRLEEATAIAARQAAAGPAREPSLG